MRYIEFKLVEGYREVTQKFSQSADPAEVEKIIAAYRDLVNRNQVQGNERNIDWWGKQGWENFARFVQAKSQQKSQTQIKRRKDVGQSHTIEENDRWLVVIPLDKAASCFHGKDTDWCTTKPNHDYFEKYFRDENVTLIYFLEKASGSKWAMAVYSNGEVDYFDKNDKELDQGQFEAQTGLNSDTYISKIVQGTEAGSKITSARDSLRQEKWDLENAIDDFTSSSNTKRDLEIETMLHRVKDLRLLRNYVLHLYYSNNDTPVEFDPNMQSLMMNKSPGLIKYIANPTERTAKAAVSASGQLIQHIRNPSREIMIAAVEENPFVIKDIENPPREIIDLAIEMSPYAVQGLANIDTETLIKSTNAYLNLSEDDGGPDKRNGDPLISEVVQWLTNFQNRGAKITDYKFYRWLADNYKYGANAISAFFLMNGKILNQEIAKDIATEHPEKFQVIRGLPTV